MQLKLFSLLALAGCAAAVIKEGDTIPDAQLDFGFPPTKIDLKTRIAGKNVILMSLPGAFTPT